MDIAAQMMEQSAIMFKIADCSKMKGNLVKKMREAAVIIRAATNVMMARTREANNQASTDELSAFRRELDVLQMENKVLRKEIERLRETTRKANPDENLYPILKESSRGASFKKKKGCVFPTRTLKRKWNIPLYTCRGRCLLPPSLPRTYASAVREGERREGTKEGTLPSHKPAPAISGPELGGVRRLISVYTSGMNEDDKRRYDALMDKISTILHQIEDMKISAARRISGAVSSTAPSLPSASNVTGGEIKTSLPQRARRGEAALKKSPATTSVIEEEAKTSTPQRSDRAAVKETPTSAITSATQTGESKKKKKKKKGKKPQGTEGPGPSIPRSQRTQDRHEGT